MSFRVKYVSESGTESDSEEIGIFSSKEEAKKARIEYMSEHLTSLEEFCKNNDDYSDDSIAEYIDTISYYSKQIRITQIWKK